MEMTVVEGREKHAVMMIRTEVSAVGFSLASRLYYILAELVSLYKAWYPGRGYRSWLQKFKPRQITGDNRYTAGHVILSPHSLDI